MSTKTQLVTADELFAMPKDGLRYELVRGELRKMSPAGFEHGALVMSVSLVLGPYVKAHDLGVCCGAETGFKLASDPDTVLAPDVGFIRRERIPAGALPRNFWPGAPDLAVEIMSPGDSVVGAGRKAGDWLAAGALAVWVVDPKKRTVTVYGGAGEAAVLHEHDELGGGEVVPGFGCQVSEIFA